MQHTRKFTAPHAPEITQIIFNEAYDLRILHLSQS